MSLSECIHMYLMSDLPHQIDPLSVEDMVDFHCKIWNKKSDVHATVFVTTPLKPPQLTGVEVPSQCHIMRSLPYGSRSNYFSGVFIRSEFVLVVKDIVMFYKGECYG